MIKKISFILMSLIISIELFGLDWNVEQKNNEYTFEIKFTDEEINSFIKNGKQIEISDGFLRSVVNDAMLISYTLVLENEVGDLSLNYISKDIKNYSLNYNLQKVSDDSTADDKLHIRNMDFINISSIPQGGSVLQIFPIIPLSKNEIKVLKSAKFTLNSYSKSITQFDGKRKIRSLKKSQSLREELPNKYINLFVDEPGLYKITGKELEKAGADLSDIDVRYLKLYRWGEEIPIRVQTNSLDSKEMLKEDAIYFLIDSLSNPYGDYKYNPFTSYEAIHIEWETDKVGKRLVERSGAVIGEPDMLPADYNSASQYTYHFERNELWDELGHMETDVDELTYISEHWFMSPEIKAGKTGYFNFNIEHVAKTPNTIEFAIRLQGNSYGGAGEHIVDIAINGYSIIDDMTWHDQYPKVIKIKDTEFYQSYLNEGENTLRIELSGEDSDVNEVFLDWFELVYEKELIATDDVIEFSAPKGYKKGNYLFELKEYSTLKDVMVIKDGLWWMRDLTVFKDNNSNKYSIIFQDSIITGDENYYAVSGDGIKSIDSLQYIDFDEEELGYTHNEGDYIIISNLEYFEELERFVELKQRKGFIPVVYNINQIYDEYATSNMTPFAIKNFLRDVYYDWSIQPEYVLLVGDVTTNGKIEEYKNWYIPTIFFQAKTTKGAVLTDIWYADIDDDYFQEYSIGRWPIRNKEHLNNMIDKTIAFDEVTNISDWLNNAVMIAGFESFFKGQTEDVINDLIPEFMSVDRFYVKNSAESVLFEVQPNDIANAFNEGKVLLNFFGHGGGAVWNDGNIFLNEEAKDLTNKLMPTVVNSLTCYSTTFNTESSIGEALMRVEGGSVTFFGASGFGFVNNDYWLIQNVYQKLFEQQMDIGKSIQYGKLNYFTTNWTPYKKTMVYQFNLLGDPSLKLPIDYTPLELTLSNKMINSGDSLKFSLPQETALFGSYNVTYDSTVMYPTNTNGYYLPIDCKMPLFHNIDVVYNGSNIEHSIKIPTDIEAS
ncbi:MAG: C25 family cysteine peptidase, partial [Candidatus Marinimicrobia bacterium]|nr:C25 family cysteine peptidase [Candidatus Neomarinimicrobiota bacterium]